MIEDPRIKQAFELIASVVADAYQRGRADAVDAMIKAASGALQQETPQKKQLVPVIHHASFSDNDEARQRAPRGSAERVIKRAIASSEGKGATVQDIMSVREGELEMMLVDSSIRGELRRGEKTGKYIEIDGRWFEPS